VQAVGFADHYRIEIPDLDLECPSQVDHVLVRHPHKTGLDLGNTASGPLIHPEELESNGQVILRPIALMTETADFGTDEVEVFHPG
jgi:hypothetical protein